MFLYPITPTMEVGDTVADFAVVGYSDENKDSSVRDEKTAGKLKVVKLSSDFASAKIIPLQRLGRLVRPLPERDQGLLGPDARSTGPTGSPSSRCSTTARTPASTRTGAFWAPG